MRLDTGAYATVLTSLQGKEPPDIAAAMFFVNRTPDSSLVVNDCPLNGAPSVLDAIESKILAAYSGVPSLQTYFVVLDNDLHDTHNAPSAGDPGGAFTFFQQIESDFKTKFGLPDAVAALDGSQSVQTVLTNFSNIVTKLGTCVYELPKGLT